MAYTQKTWADGSAGGTPVTAAELNRMETGIDMAHDHLIGIQVWNGTAWSARPAGVIFVEAYSDGTAGSVHDLNAMSPTGAVNGDRWWKAIASA